MKLGMINGTRVNTDPITFNFLKAVLTTWRAREALWWECHLQRCWSDY